MLTITYYFVAIILDVFARFFQILACYTLLLSKFLSFISNFLSIISVTCFFNIAQQVLAIIFVAAILVFDYSCLSLIGTLIRWNCVMVSILTW